MRDLLRTLPSLAEKFSLRPSESAPVVNDEGKNLYLDAALMDLMGRYGRISHHLERHGDDLAQKSTFTSVPTIPANMLGNNAWTGVENTSLPNQEITVRLLLERARGVGRVDVFSGADLYCAAFVGYSGKDQGNGEHAGNVLFQTTIRRGKSEADWIWNEVGCVVHDFELNWNLQDSLFAPWCCSLCYPTLHS